MDLQADSCPKKLPGCPNPGKQKRKKAFCMLFEPLEQLAKVETYSSHDCVDFIADPAAQKVASQTAIGLHVTDDGLDRRAFS